MVITEKYNLEELIHLLSRQADKKKQPDDFLKSGILLINKAKEHLDRDEVFELLYLFNQCKKGYYEILKRNRISASWFFEKIESWISTRYTEKPYCAAIAFLFLAKNYADMQADYIRAKEMLIKGIDAIDTLFAKDADGLFIRLKNFMLVLYNKALVKEGEVAAAVNNLTEELCRHLGSATGEQASDTDECIYRLFTDLYGFSLFSDAVAGYMKQHISDACNRQQDMPGTGYTGYFIAAERAIAGDDMTVYFEKITDMARSFSDPAQAAMLAYQFAQGDKYLAMQNDPMRTSFALAFEIFVKRTMPGYVSEKMFDSKKQLQ